MAGFGRLRPKPYSSETERRILNAMGRFEHQPDGFIEIFATEFLKLQIEDGFKPEFRNIKVMNILGLRPRLKAHRIKQLI